MFRSYSETICRTDPKPKQALSTECYNCDICDESNWLTETDVELHRKQRHFNEIREQMDANMERFCTICMKIYENQSELIAHVKIRHLYSSPEAKRVEREIFICDYCDHIFFNKDMLVAHIKYSHMWSTQERNTKTFTCPKCKKICKLKSIWFHLQLHEIPSISVCDICITNFVNTRELMKHLESHPMYYKCEICNYQTTKDFHFERHLVQHHNMACRERPLDPKLVRGAFRRPTMAVTSLFVRYNIHHALRGLDLPRILQICILCREICTNKAEMKQHVLRDHHEMPENKRLWRCACGDEFTNQILLKHHVFKMKGTHRQLSEHESAQDFDVPVYIEIPNDVESNETQYKRLENNGIEIEVTCEEEVGKEDTEEEEMAVVESGEGVEVPIEGVCIVSENDNLTYVYAEVDEDQLVTTDIENEEEVIGF